MGLRYLAASDENHVLRLRILHLLLYALDMLLSGLLLQAGLVVLQARYLALSYVLKLVGRLLLLHPLNVHFSR